MDIGRLRTLRELSLRKTMAAVAEALLISPSAVSQQISQLEDELGVRLIERRGRGVHLTPAGLRLVAHAERIIGILDEAKTDIAEMKRVVAGELRVAAFPSVAAALLPSTMRKLEQTHPQLQVVLDVLEPSDGLAALRAWQADIVLIDDLALGPNFAKETVDTIHIIDDVLYAMVEPSHPLARQDTISLADLRDEKWALDTASSDYSNIVIRACAAAGFQPATNGYCDGFEVVVALVEAGCSVSVMPGLRVRIYKGDYCARKIVPEIRRSISVAFRRGELRNPAIKAFVSEIQRSARQMGEGEH